MLSLSLPLSLAPKRSNTLFVREGRVTGQVQKKRTASGRRGEITIARGTLAAAAAFGKFSTVRADVQTRGQPTARVSKRVTRGLDAMYTYTRIQI